SVCVVEPDQRRAGELRNRFGDDERIDIVETLPADTRYDVAVLSMPPRYHGEYVERLGGRCDRLLIEKPIARNLREAEAIVRHLESSTAVAFVCHIRRALGSFRLARDIVAEGLLGELREVSVHEGSVFSWRAASLGSFSRELNGGGVLLDTGPHTLDLLFQVFQRIELK